MKKGLSSFLRIFRYTLKSKGIEIFYGYRSKEVKNVCKKNHDFCTMVGWTTSFNKIAIRASNFEVKSQSILPNPNIHSSTKINK